MNIEDRKPLQIPANLESFRSLAHGSMKFVFETQENINPELLSKIMSYQGKLGWLNFSCDQIEAVDIVPLIGKKVDRYMYDGKTPSQRLRAVLYLIHERQGGDKVSFEDYYKRIMEKLIDSYKNKLSEMS